MDDSAPRVARILDVPILGSLRVTFLQLFMERRSKGGM